MPELVLMYCLPSHFAGRDNIRRLLPIYKINKICSVVRGPLLSKCFYVLAMFCPNDILLSPSPILE